MADKSPHLPLSYVGQGRKDAKEKREKIQKVARQRARKKIIIICGS
jgi:hypothetical protein